MKKFLFGFAISLSVALGLNQSISYAQFLPTIDIFYGEECPHCHNLLAWIDEGELAKIYPDIQINKYEIWHNAKNLKLFTERLKKLNLKSEGVPTSFIGNDIVIGFNKTQILEKFRENFGTDTAKTNKIPANSNNVDPHKFIKNIPLLGEVDLTSWTWPMAAVVLGYIDGFNPCSMWVLISLLAILINLGNRRKLILIGSIFIIASYLVYAAALFAWLEFFKFISFIGPIQWLLGFGAIAAGIYAIYGATKNPTGACKVTSTQTKKSIAERMKSLANESNFLLALGGIILLAFSVNLIELVCSAGVPAIFTGLLAFAEISSVERIFAIILYLIFYMLNDMIVFAVAIWTMGLKTFSGRGHFYLQLVGGIVLISIGLYQLIKLFL